MIRSGVVAVADRRAPLMAGPFFTPPPHIWLGDRWHCMACGQEWPDPCQCPCHRPAKHNGDNFLGPWLDTGGSVDYLGVQQPPLSHSVSDL